MPSITKPKAMPPQHREHQPGDQFRMYPQPRSEPKLQAPGTRLSQKVALVTGGDSGIGRAVAVAFAQEGATVMVVYLDEHEDAKETQRLVRETGSECWLFSGDVGLEKFCKDAIQATIDKFGKLDVLVNNAAEQFPSNDIEKITEEQLEHTFRTNIFSMFYMVKAALPYLVSGARIINTASVTAYRGSAHLLDYSATKGAIVAFTRSLAQQLVKHGIYVNAVAPGPIWTPLIPASFSDEEVAKFGTNVPMGRPGQPFEIAPAYVFLATDGADYMTGQVLHPNGGEIVNG